MAEACVRYIAPGDTIDFLNDTGAAISSGELVKAGALIGYAERDVAIGGYGALRVAGGGPIVEAATNVAEAASFATGETVYYDPATKEVYNATPGGSAYLLGHAVPGAKGTVGGLTAADGCGTSAGGKVRVKMVSA